MQSISSERRYKQQQLIIKKSNSQPIEDDLQKLTRSSLGKPQEEQTQQIKSLKKINATLRRFRLSYKEVKVYLYLARYGAQRAQKISETLDIQRTESYKILGTLEEGGYIYRIIEKPMKYMATPFEKVLDMEIEQRKQKTHQLEKEKIELIKIWESLPVVHEKEDNDENLQIIEGKKQICAKIVSLLKDSKFKLTAVISDSILIWMYNSSFFEELEKLSKKTDMDIKILTEYSPVSSFVLEQVSSLNCDFAFTQINEKSCFLVSDLNRMLLFTKIEDEKPCVMETNINSMLSSHNNLFDLLWNQKK